MIIIIIENSTEGKKKVSSRCLHYLPAAILEVSILPAYTAVSRKVVLQSGKSLRGNVESYYG